MKGYAALIMVVMTSLAFPAEWVTHLERESFASGDFDGDGSRDALRVERETGRFQILYGPQDNARLSPVRDSGLRNVDRLVVGRFRFGDYDTMVMCSQEANLILDLNNINVSRVFPVAQTVQQQGVGPQELLLLGQHPSSQDPREDLVVFNTWMPPADAVAEVIGGGDEGALFPSFPVNSFHPEKAVGLSSQGGPDSWGAGFVKLPVGERLQFFDVTEASIETLFSLQLDEAGHHMLYGLFPEAPTGAVLLWKPGQTQLSSLKISFLGGGQFGFTSAPVDVDLGLPIASVQQLIVNGQSYLFVLYTDGGGGLYLFDGEHAPLLQQSFPVPDAAHSLSGAVLLDDGDLLLFSRNQPGGPSEAFERYEHDGAQYQRKQVQSLELQPMGQQGANVILWDQEPFVTENPRALWYGSAPDWSLEAFSNFQQVRIRHLVDQGVESGLGNESVMFPDMWPQEATHALVNQWEKDVAIAMFDPPSRVSRIQALISPEAGLYATAQQVEVKSSSSGGTLFVRRGDAAWAPYQGAFWVYQDEVISAYVAGPGPALGPVAQQQFRFQSGVDDMDSDGDTVPDYVEIEQRKNEREDAGIIDPTLGADTDGDGLSDKDELLNQTLLSVADSDGDGHSDFREVQAGSDPNDPLSIPNGSQVLVQDPFVANSAVVDVKVRANFELELPSTPGNSILVNLHPVDGTNLKLFSSTQALLGNAKVDQSDQSFARFVQVAPNPWMSLYTDQFFEIRGIHASLLYRQNGLELLALIGVGEEEVRPLYPNPYQHQGGDASVEAQNWIAAARVAGGADRPSLTREVDVDDCMAALLVEQLLGERFLERGELDSEHITLFPRRVGETGRVQPSREQLWSLQKLGPNGEAALLLEPLLADLTHALKRPDASAQVQALQNLIRDLYAVVALHHEDAAGSLALPVDLLRDFIDDGQLPAYYKSRSTTSTADHEQAFAGVQELLGNITERPVMQDLLLTPRASAQGCELFELETGESVYLINAQGDSYPLPRTFSLTDAMQIRVTGFSDRSRDCADITLEVIELQFTSFISKSSQDIDGNLLLDHWERLHHGQLGASHLANSDGDAYSDLQEMLEGSDPGDPLSIPAVPAVSFDLPELTVTHPAGQATRISWNWPAAYQGDFEFFLERTSTLTNSFAPSAASGGASGNEMHLDIPELLPQPDTEFYRIGIRLR